jgi:CheY-like chemotaxis protein
LDVLLPDFSGVEVCRQIKADPALSDVFVVLISGVAIDTRFRFAEGGLDRHR